MPVDQQAAVARTHCLERTSPIGEKFIGKCVLCGQEGLTFKQALEHCPNPKGITKDDAVIMALEGERCHTQ